MQLFGKQTSFLLALAIASAGIPVVAQGAAKGSEGQIVWSLDHEGLGRFCYDSNPAVIYFKYDVPTKTTSIRSASLDGTEKIVATFPGAPDERSLSCSDDGQTIAALNADKTQLYIIKSGIVSTYTFYQPLLYSVAGLYSVLGGNGNILSVPGKPEHGAGPDFLKQLDFFKSTDTERTFIVNNDIYVVGEKRIFVYNRIGQSWVKHGVTELPAGFGVNEILKCGSRIVASTSNDEIVRHFTIRRSSLASDWLSKIGLFRLLRNFSDKVIITGGYGRCAFPLLDRGSIQYLMEGLAFISDDDIKVVAVSGPKVAMSSDEIRLSKDGCYALVRLFKHVAKIPQFVLPHELVIMKVSSGTCRS